MCPTQSTCSWATRQNHSRTFQSQSQGSASQGNWLYQSSLRHRRALPISCECDAKTISIATGVRTHEGEGVDDQTPVTPHANLGVPYQPEMHVPVAVVPAFVNGYEALPGPEGYAGHVISAR